MPQPKPKRVTKKAILQRIIALYRAEHPGPFTTNDLAAWSMLAGLWPVNKNDWHWVGETLERKQG